MRDSKGRFVKGNIPYSVNGVSIETKQKISASLTGKKQSSETIAKRALKLKGKKRTLVQKLKVSGKNNYQWQGDNVNYRNLHKWIQKQSGKATKCSIDSRHISTRYHWANISGEYKRDIADWRELCPSCNRLDGVKIAQRFSERGQIQLVNS